MLEAFDLMGCHGNFFYAPPVHLFLLRWPPVCRKSTKGPVELGTLSTVEPYVLKIFAQINFVRCMAPIHVSVRKTQCIQVMLKDMYMYKSHTNHKNVICMPSIS